MRIFLSGVEWIMQAPEGNRLRWWYPFDDVDSGDYRSMPKAIVVERATVDEDIIIPELGGGAAAFPISGNVPYNWWDDLGDVDLFNLALVCTHQLATAVQAIGGPVSSQSSRRPVSFEMPFRSGPRNVGQSAPEAMQTNRNPAARSGKRVAISSISVSSQPGECREGGRGESSFKSIR